MSIVYDVNRATSLVETNDTLDFNY